MRRAVVPAILLCLVCLSCGKSPHVKRKERAAEGGACVTFHMKDGSIEAGWIKELDPETQTFTVDRGGGKLLKMDARYVKYVVVDGDDNGSAELAEKLEHLSKPPVKPQPAELKGLTDRFFEEMRESQNTAKTAERIRLYAQKLALEAPHNIPAHLARVKVAIGKAKLKGARKKVLIHLHFFKALLHLLEKKPIESFGTMRKIKDMMRTMPEDHPKVAGEYRIFIGWLWKLAAYKKFMEENFRDRRKRGPGGIPGRGFGRDRGREGPKPR